MRLVRLLVLSLLICTGAVASASEVSAQVGKGTPSQSQTPSSQTSVVAEDHGPVEVQVLRIVAWPVTLLLLALLLAFNQRLGRMLGLTSRIVKKISAGGIEMEIDADAVKEIQTHLRGSFDELIYKARVEYDRMSALMSIDEHLESAMTNALPSVLRSKKLPTNPPNLRGTVHVHDIVFSEYLYQLSDYYPKGGGSGRRFSHRFGIIGRSWRLGESVGEGNAVAGARGAERTLIAEWGMTRREVRAQGTERPACLSVILRATLDDEFPVGVLYIDSTKVEAFGDDNAAGLVAKELEDANEVVALRGALERALKPLRLAAPELDVGKPSR
jgi:hypothetical protein